MAFKKTIKIAAVSLAAIGVIGVLGTSPQQKNSTDSTPVVTIPVPTQVSTPKPAQIQQSDTSSTQTQITPTPISTNPAPTATTPQASTPSNCDPNYSGACVPNVYPQDVDCAGGSGNGPYYVSGPVYVTGTDRYGLDRDGDGVACE